MKAQNNISRLLKIMDDLRLNCPWDKKQTLDSLGLKGIGSEVVHDPTPSILGMIRKVKHLVSVQEL